MRSPFCFLGSAFLHPYLLRRGYKEGKPTKLVCQRQKRFWVDKFVLDLCSIFLGLRSDYACPFLRFHRTAFFLYWILSLFQCCFYLLHGELLWIIMQMESLCRKISGDNYQPGKALQRVFHILQTSSTVHAWDRYKSFFYHSLCILFTTMSINYLLISRAKAFSLQRPWERVSL